MSNPKEARVLSRAGARELTSEEVRYVSGSGQVHTNVCSINLETGARDGDACH
jgi:hypothetical protein